MDQAEWDRLIASIRSAGEDLDRAVAASMALGEITDRSRIPELERLIQDDDFFVREAAATPLISLKGIDAFPLLLEALERGAREGHDNDGLAFEISELVECHKAEVTPRLLEMLRARRSETRSHAAWLLGFVSDVVSPEPLIEALKDPSPDVRSSAVGSLSSFKGHPGVLAAILPLLDHAEEQVRVCAASALGHLGDLRAVPDLRRAMSDPSERVRYFADYALGLLGAKGRC
jgi:HEAT repeat protein